MYPETTEKELLNLWELINVAPKNQGLKNGDFVAVLLSHSLLDYFYPVLTKLLENSIIGEGLITEINVLFYDYSKKSYISESQADIFEARLFMSEKMMEVPEIRFKINLKKLKEYFYFLLDQFESNELDFQDVPQIKEFLFQRASVVKVLESTLKENFARNNISFSYEFFTDKNFAPLAVLFCLEKKGFIKIIKLTSDNKAKYLIRVALQDSFDNLLESINKKYGFKKEDSLEKGNNHNSKQISSQMNGEKSKHAQGSNFSESSNEPTSKEKNELALIYNGSCLFDEMNPELRIILRIGFPKNLYKALNDSQSEKQIQLEKIEGYSHNKLKLHKKALAKKFNANSSSIDEVITQNGRLIGRGKRLKFQGLQ